MTEPEIIKICKHPAKITYDPETGRYSGNFTELTGGACFFAYSRRDIRAAGEDALRSLLAHKKRNGIEIRK